MDLERARGLIGPAAPLNGARYLKVAEVAKALRVSSMTVYRLVHSGELPSVRVGRSYRIAEHDALAYLNDPDR